MPYTSVQVTSKDQFENVVNTFIRGGRADMGISFEIDSNIEGAVYCEMLESIVANNKELEREDKVQNPRPRGTTNRPLPVFRCSTMKEIEDIQNAIGTAWRIIIQETEYDPNSNSRYNNMMNMLGTYALSQGILDYENDPEF